MTREPTFGRCPLCGEQKALRWSHIVPAWAYKRALSPQVKPPHPLEFADGGIVMTSKHLAEEMLCDACEGLTSTFDEYVAGLAYSEPGVAPIIQATTVDLTLRQQVVSLTQLDVDKLKRFSLSVIWRAHVSRCLPNLSLGPYAPPVRAYLRDEGGFPTLLRTRATFFVDCPEAGGPAGLLERLIVAPQSNRTDGCIIHWFMVGGFRFEVCAGRIPPEAISALCLHHARSPQLLVLDAHASGMVNSVARSMHGAKLRGRMAKNL